MKIEEIAIQDRYTYTEICPCCSLEQEILTREDFSTQDYMDVYLQCQCGEYIKFELPVN